MNSEKILQMKLFLKYFLSKPSNYYDNYNNGKQNIVVALAADYGNLGDVAITFAQTEFLLKKYPEANIIDFPISKTFTHMKSLKRIIKPNDIITITGGGNTGDMYDDIEYSRQFIIKQFPNNKIISFPQTIDFSDTHGGNKALSKARKVYGKHKNLTLSARENKSLTTYTKCFSENIIVKAPDIVLSLDIQDDHYKREGILICLRKDNEKNITENQENKLIELLYNNNKLKFRDTHINKNRMPIAEREKELANIWTEFKKAELVITDRLHGMIFCAITATPCLVIDNHNQKVSGVYNSWIKDLNYIKLFDSEDVLQVNYIIKKMLDENKNNKYNPLTKEFDQLFHNQ